MQVTIQMTHWSLTEELEVQSIWREGKKTGFKWSDGGVKTEVVVKAGGSKVWKDTEKQKRKAKAYFKCQGRADEEGTWILSFHKFPLTLCWACAVCIHLEAGGPVWGNMAKLPTPQKKAIRFRAYHMGLDTIQRLFHSITHTQTHTFTCTNRTFRQ